VTPKSLSIAGYPARFQLQGLGESSVTAPDPDSVVAFVDKPYSVIVSTVDQNGNPSLSYDGGWVAFTVYPAAGAYVAPGPYRFDAGEAAHLFDAGFIFQAAGTYGVSAHDLDGGLARNVNVQVYIRLPDGGIISADGGIVHLDGGLSDGGTPLDYTTEFCGCSAGSLAPMLLLAGFVAIRLRRNRRLNA
jgi:hypothetical protein